MCVWGWRDPLLNDLGMERESLNSTKCLYQKLSVKIILDGKI